MFGNFFGNWFSRWFGNSGTSEETGLFNRVSRISLSIYRWSEVHSNRISERVITLSLDKYNEISLTFSIESPILEIFSNYSLIQNFEESDSEIQQVYYKITRFI